SEAVGAMYAGAAFGSMIPIPVVGTLAGAVVGYAIGGLANTIYDGVAHNDWDLDNFALW
ncbi:TPA: phage tail protein, partial [Streptococcus agalactiae]|nr:phage tail protein [Streptococcus agalactiae]